jgi:transposase-like protein
MDETECPHCGSKDISKFEQYLYIVEGETFTKKPFYGCKGCKSAFVILNKEGKVKDAIIKTTKATNVQKTLNRLSKGCLGVLENVK